MSNMMNSASVAIARQPSRVTKQRTLDTYYTGRISGSDVPCRLVFTIADDGQFAGEGQKIYISMSDADAERIGRELIGLVERARARGASSSSPQEGPTDDR